MKTAFDELISRLGITEERSGNFLDRSIETSQTENSKKTTTQNIQKLQETTKGITYVQQEYQKREERKEQKKYLK